MVLKSIQNQTLQEVVYQQLYDAIIEGKIAPGEKITLRKLANELNVSVMPVREALRRLEAKLFVNVEKNKQITVSELTLSHFMQIFEARLLLEGHAARTASLIRSERSVKQLENLQQKIEESEDHDAIMKLNQRFHRVIYQEAKLPVFLDMIDSLWERVSPYFYIYSKNQEAGWQKGFYDYHTGMIEGMREKNPDKVYKWLERDLSEVSENLEVVFG